MHDAPSMAVKQKKKSSMRVCFDLVKAGEADAVVSAGNSGAMMACGLFVMGRLPGVERPAIVTTFPTRTGECALLDVGANVDPKPAVLAQFGVLGAVYARLLHGKARPKVGLLSNGSEEHKGTALTREAHQILSRVEGMPDAAFQLPRLRRGTRHLRGEDRRGRDRRFHRQRGAERRGGRGRDDAGHGARGGVALGHRWPSSAPR